MSLLRNIMLYVTVGLCIASIIVVLICWLLDKPLYTDSTDSTLTTLEKQMATSYDIANS